MNILQARTLKRIFTYVGHVGGNADFGYTRAFEGVVTQVQGGHTAVEGYGSQGIQVGKGIIPDMGNLPGNDHRPEL